MLYSSATLHVWQKTCMKQTATFCFITRLLCIRAAVHILLYLEIQVRRNVRPHGEAGQSQPILDLKTHPSGN